MNNNVFVKKIVPVVATSAMTVGILFAGVGNSNAATGNPEQLPSCVGVNFNVGSGDCEDIVITGSFASNSDYASSSASVVNGVRVDSNVTVLAYVNAKGMSKKEMRNAQTYVLKKDTWLWTSYKDVNGKEVWHKKLFKKGFKLYKGKDGWFHDPRCNNKVVIKGKKLPKSAIKITGKVKIVKKFKINTTSKLVLSGSAKSKSASWANAYDSKDRLICHGEGTGEATASYYVAATATVKHKSTLKASIAASMKSAEKKFNLQMGAKTKEQVRTAAVVKANGEALAESRSGAVCYTVVTPPPTVPPTPEKPKVNIEIDTLNDVDLTDPNCEGTRTECESYLVSTVHATVPSGVSGTVRISSNIGTVGFTNGTPTNPLDDVKTLNLGSGQHDIKYRFNAPTEGTSAVITFTFTPSGDSAVTPEPVSTRVVLNAPPTPPL